jgi:histidinol dehydrogenase
VTEATVREILETVKRQGNQALLDYTEKFEQQVLTQQQLRVNGSELDAAYQQIPKELLKAIQQSGEKIEAFHRQRVPKSWVHFADDDVVFGKRYTPVERAGLYVPNGTMTQIGAVLLQAIPAKLAQVPQVVMVTPPGPSLKIPPAVLVAAQEAGVSEIYRVGGAQAIAALAYGTETIPKVDVITGTGNLYVSLAKKMVYGIVGIDGWSGPSELLIVADSEANPRQIAADLLAQAERDPHAAAILLTPDPLIAEKVQQDVSQQLQNRPQPTLTEKAIAHYGLIVVVEQLEDAAELSNQFAPEHLELAVSDPWTILEMIRHAGTIFLGSATPKAIGDYLGGSATPTSGTARYASALSVETFMKSSNLIQYSPAALKKMSGTLQILAQAEGLPSCADSVRGRILDFGF